MPRYAKKRTYTKKRTYAKKKMYKRKGVTPTVRKLARTVKKLTKISYDKVQILQTDGNNVSLGGLTFVTPNIIPLMNNFVGATPLWGYQSADIKECTKAYLSSMRLHITISQNNEPDLIRYSIFLVSLKDEAADGQTFNNSTGGLTLQVGTHYVYMGGSQTDQVILSPRMFNIHKTWRKFTGGIVGGQTTQPAVRQYSHTIVPSKKMYYNPRGNLFNDASPIPFAFPPDPSQNYYMLIFTDNLKSDVESPTLTYNNVQTWSIPS